MPAAWAAPLPLLRGTARSPRSCSLRSACTRRHPTTSSKEGQKLGLMPPGCHAWTRTSVRERVVRMHAQCVRTVRVCTPPPHDCEHDPQGYTPHQRAHCCVLHACCVVGGVPPHCALLTCVPGLGMLVPCRQPMPRVCVPEPQSTEQVLQPVTPHCTQWKRRHKQHTRASISIHTRRWLLASTVICVPFSCAADVVARCGRRTCLAGGGLAGCSAHGVRLCVSVRILADHRARLRAAAARARAPCADAPRVRDRGLGLIAVAAAVAHGVGAQAAHGAGGDVDVRCHPALCTTTEEHVDNERTR